METSDTTCNEQHLIFSDITEANEEVIRLKKESRNKWNDFLMYRNRKRNEIKELQEMNTKLKIEKDKWKTAFDKKVESTVVFKSFVEDLIENQKKQLIDRENELNTFKSDYKKLQNLSEKHSNHCIHLKSQNEILLREKQELFSAFNDERNNNENSLIQMRNKVYELTKENKQLENKIQLQINYNVTQTLESEKSIDIWKIKCNDLNTRLEIQIKENLKQSQNHKKAMAKTILKMNALNKRLLFCRNENEMNKRKQIATQFSSVAQERVYKNNTKKTHQLTEVNTNSAFDKFETKLMELSFQIRNQLNVDNRKVAADGIRETTDRSHDIISDAIQIAETPIGEKIVCPLCAKAFANNATFRRHLQTIHKMDNILNASQSESQNNCIIETIDIMDD